MNNAKNTGRTENPGMKVGRTDKISLSVVSTVAFSTLFQSGSVVVVTVVSSPIICKIMDIESVRVSLSVTIRVMV